jgi:hypothetical protein
MTYASLQLHADWTYLVGSNVATVSLIADGTTVYTQNITSDDPVRLPAMTRAYIWEIVLTGNIPIRRVAIATSVAELAGA